jgi:hypothetical protein
MGENEPRNAVARFVTHRLGLPIPCSLLLRSTGYNRPRRRNFPPPPPPPRRRVVSLLRHSLLLARHFPPPPPRSLAVSLSGPRALATLVEFVPLPISRGPHLHPPTDAHPSRRGGVRARMGCCEDQPTSPTRWRGIILGGHLPTSLNGGEGRRWWWWWRVVAAATRRVVGNDGGGGDDEAGGGW